MKKVYSDKVKIKTGKPKVVG